MTKTNKNFLARAAMTLLFALLSSAGAWAETEVVAVGSGSTASSNLPSNQFTKYFMSQQIYTSGEIGRSGSITSIAFYNYDTGRPRKFDIYLTHVDKSSFDSSTDWVTVSAEDLVFSGTVTLIDWTFIELDKVFEYNGTQNLLLTVYDYTDSQISNDNLCGVCDGGNQALFYKSSDSLDPTKLMEKEGTLESKKNKLQLTFETSPRPSKLAAVNIGDKSAQIECELRGGATAWNLRYREAVEIGIPELEWTTVNDLTTRSQVIDGLKSATKYEAQVQGIFADGVSDWTDPLIFTTNCCPVEQQTELTYKLRSTNGWFDFAAQIVDGDTGAEVALLRSPNSGLVEGSVTLCCGHTYKVNWIYDEEHSWNNSQLGFSLYLEPGDLFYTLAYGEAPEKNEQLTEFVMDCADYCAPMPKSLEIDDIFHDGALFSFSSTTENIKVAWSTDAGFDPATATNTVSAAIDMTGEGGTGSYRLTGLESLTDYYVSLQSVCTGSDGKPTGSSRWTPPTKFTTGAEEAAVENITITRISSTKVRINWTEKGEAKKHNIYIRQQTGAGKPVSSDQVLTFDLDEDGYAFEKTGESSWGSFIYGSTVTALQPVNNWLTITGLSEGDVVKTKLEEGKTASDPNEKARVSEVFSLGAESLTKGLDAEAKMTEIRTGLVYLSKKALDGKKLTKSEWKKKYKEYRKAIEDWGDAPDGSEEEKALAKQVKDLKRELGLDRSKLKKAARKSIRAGYKAYKKAKPWNKKTREAEGSEEYYAWINHEEGSGFLDVSELEIVSEANWSEWEVVEGVTGNSYTFEGLTPGATYEVMIEPVYEDGTTGPMEGALFTTLGTETETIPADFSVGKDKKVQFAKGNLRYRGDMYEGEWSIATQPYEILGSDNVDDQSSSSYPADLKDLLCWSTVNNYYGVSNYYYYDDAEANELFRGDFADWGQSPALIADLGEGWRTLGKDEWNYILNDRPNAAQLRSVATVADVKGLVILPDEWNAPTGVMLSDNMTAEEWATIEQTGGVFLPAAGQMITTYEDYTATTTVVEAGSYWTSTPSGDKSEMYAFAMTFTDTDVTPGTDLLRRTATAVRLVKDSDGATAISAVKQTPAVGSNGWYSLDGRQLSGKPARKGIYIHSGKKVVIR